MTVRLIGRLLPDFEHVPPAVLEYVCHEVGRKDLDEDNREQDRPTGIPLIGAP